MALLGGLWCWEAGRGWKGLEGLRLVVRLGCDPVLSIFLAEWATGTGHGWLPGDDLIPFPFAVLQRSPRGRRWRL